MDLAYDHIAEQSYTDRAPTPTPSKPTPGSKDSQTTVLPSSDTTPQPASPARASLQTEFQETFKAFSASPWGAKLGGLWGNVRKQGETYYEEARKEAEAKGSEAWKGVALLGGKVAGNVTETPTQEKEKVGGREKSGEVVGVEGDSTEAQDAKIRENETFIARFKSEAAKRLKDVQKAEDAADEALLRFGTNIRAFLRDAVAVAPPDYAAVERGNSTVMFESKDATTGKRVIHTSRFDAQLHVIHTTMTSFTGSAMERVVPEKVEYKDFWTRYYFLRHVVEAQDERRKEMLKGKFRREVVVFQSLTFHSIGRRRRRSGMGRGI